MKIQSAIVAALSLLAGSATAQTKFWYTETFQLKTAGGSCVTTAGSNDPQMRTNDRQQEPLRGYSGLVTNPGRACEYITFGRGYKLGDRNSYRFVMSAVPYSTGDKEAAYTSYLCGIKMESMRFDILRLGISTNLAICSPLTFARQVPGSIGEVRVKREGDTEYRCLFSAGATGNIYADRCSNPGDKLLYSSKATPIAIEAGTNYDSFVGTELDNVLVKIRVGR